MSAAVTLSSGAGLVQLPLSFPLASGLVLEGAMLGFEEIGAEDGPAVIVLGGISAGRHVASSPADPSPGWWEPFVGPGRAIDTSRFRVIGVDPLGGVGASSGPESTGLGARFPQVTAEDQARAIAHLLDHLGIERLHAIVGSSYGGIVALRFAADFPSRVARIVAIGAAHESHPLASAWRLVQRRILELGLATGAEREAVAIARALAMTTYRSPAELEERFHGDREGLEGWLEARGRDFAARFDAASYLCLSRAIELSRVEPERVRVPATIVAVEGDRLVPIGQARELARRLAGPVNLVEIASVYGHDAFLKEVGTISPIVRQALEVLP